MSKAKPERPSAMRLVGAIAAAVAGVAAAVRLVKQRRATTPKK